VRRRGQRGRPQADAIRVEHARERQRCRKERICVDTRVFERRARSKDGSCRCVQMSDALTLTDLREAKTVADLDGNTVRDALRAGRATTADFYELAQLCEASHPGALFEEVLLREAEDNDAPADETWRRWKDRCDFRAALSSAGSRFALVRAFNALIRRAGPLSATADEVRVEASRVLPVDDPTGVNLAGWVTDGALLESVGNLAADAADSVDEELRRLCGPFFDVVVAVAAADDGDGASTETMKARRAAIEGASLVLRHWQATGGIAARSSECDPALLPLFQVKADTFQRLLADPTHQRIWLVLLMRLMALDAASSPSSSEPPLGSLEELKTSISAMLGDTASKVVWEVVSTSEESWRAWKDAGRCAPLAVATAPAPAAPEADECDKRPATPPPLTAETRFAAYRQRKRCRPPSLEAMGERIRDAMEPDSGVEEKYHPKHDQVYCFRGRRRFFDALFLTAERRSADPFLAAGGGADATADAAPTADAAGE